MAEEFDRVQPHDNEAEVAVLGSMLLTVDAIVDVTEEIRGSDFYSMKHEIVFDAIVELFGQNQVADPITVSDKLQHDGTLTKIGGRPYLHTLMASVPTAANAGYYARIVREKSIMRRLVSAGTRVVQLGYSEEGAEIDELVDQAQQEIFAVATDRASTDYVSMNTMVNSLVEHLEAIQKNDDLFGVPPALPTWMS